MILISFNSILTQIYSEDNQRHIICVLTDGIQVVLYVLIFLPANYKVEGYYNYVQAEDT